MIDKLRKFLCTHVWEIKKIHIFGPLANSFSTSFVYSKYKCVYCDKIKSEHHNTTKDFELINE